MQLPLLHQTARERLHHVRVSVKRPTTRETLARNLRVLMGMRDWSQVDLAKKSGVSQRMISHVLKQTTGCSVETADALAKPFNLAGWHLLIPNLPDEILRSPTLSKLVQDYLTATDAGRVMIAMVADREAIYGQNNGNGTGRSS